MSTREWRLAMLFCLCATALPVACSDDHDEGVDIVIRNVKMVDANSVEVLTPHAGDPAFIEFEERCIGFTGWVRYIVTIDDVVVAQWQSRSFDSGRFARSGFGLQMPPAGSHVISAVADPDNLIPEKDETNNRALKTITVIEWPPR